jgi:hypothetical protein
MSAHRRSSPSLAMSTRDATGDLERTRTPFGAARGYASLGNRLSQ